MARDIDDGRLRHDEPYRVWIGMGSAHRCAGCSRRIGPTDMELELHFESRPTPLKMHAACFTCWHRLASKHWRSSLRRPAMGRQR